MLIAWYGFAYTFGFAFMMWWLWRRRAALGWTQNQVMFASIIFVIATSR